jgi:hypothetical protein
MLLNTIPNNCHCERSTAECGNLLAKWEIAYPKGTLRGASRSQKDARDDIVQGAHDYNKIRED